MKIHVILIAVVMAVSTRTLAQFAAEATITSMIDDNVSNNSLRASDKITELSIKGEYDYESPSSSFQVVASGTFDYFSAIEDRSFYTLSVGPTYSHLFDEERETLMKAGGNFSRRKGRGEYSFFDNSQLSLFTNVKHYLSERIIGRASYTFRSITFSELSDFDYTEHYAFIQATFFLPTSTTVIVETDIGTKLYSTPNISPTQATLHGQSRGSRQSGATSGPSVTQFIGLVRIGQPLMEGTGLSLTSSFQANLQKESRYLTSEYGTISDDELFDDHYGYEGWHSGLTITQLLPASITLKATGSIQGRKYSERAAYDLAGNVIASTRFDTRKVFTFLFEKHFEATDISLGLTYDYIVNASNDALYSYTNNALTARLAYSY